MNIYEIISVVSALIGMVLITAVFAVFMRTYERREKDKIESGTQDARLIQYKKDNGTAAAKRKRKVTSVIRTVIFWLFIVLFVPFIVLSLITRINGGKLVAPMGIMAVATGSMGEVHSSNLSMSEKWRFEGFGQYSLIVLERADAPEEIGLYDIIAYKNDEGLTIIHRVVAIEGDGEDLRYITRGDANGADDEYHPVFSDVLGKYSGKHVEYLGIAVLFIQSYTGLITVIALVILLIISDGTFRRISQCREKRLEVIGADGEKND